MREEGGQQAIAASSSVQGRKQWRGGEGASKKGGIGARRVDVMAHNNNSNNNYNHNSHNSNKSPVVDEEVKELVCEVYTHVSVSCVLCLCALKHARVDEVRAHACGVHPGLAHLPDLKPVAQCRGGCSLKGKVTAGTGKGERL